MFPLLEKKEKNPLGHAGFEPATYGLKVRRTTAVLMPQSKTTWLPHSAPGQLPDSAHGNTRFATFYTPAVTGGPLPTHLTGRVAEHVVFDTGRRSGHALGLNPV